MKDKIKDALANMKKYNRGTMFFEEFGFDTAIEYDVLVVAPGWNPVKTILDPSFKVTLLAQHAYSAGYLVEKEDIRMAWILTSSGATHVLDYMIICSEMRFKKCIFAGAVGGLSGRFAVGDLCTPEECISAVYVNRYLDETLPEYKPLDVIKPDIEYTEKIIALAKDSGYDLKKGKVFCTDSFAMEYSHLDEIRATGAELIEMETGTFYTMAELYEIPSIALLAVSDNSATGDPLFGRSDEKKELYQYTRGYTIPDLIMKIAKM